MSNIIKLSTKNRVSVSVKGSTEKSVFHNDDDFIKTKMEQSFEDGFDQGYKQAIQQLEEKYNDHILEKYSTFENLILQLNEAVVEYEKDYERIVLEVAYLVANKILKKEVEQNSIIADVLQDSIKKVLGANNIIVKINPEDLKWISAINSGFIKDEILTKVKFEEDSNIELGGCIVETEIGNVDSRISSQMNEIKKQLEQSIGAD